MRNRRPDVIISRLPTRWWLVSIFVLTQNSLLLCKPTAADAANVRFREDTNGVYLLRPPTQDRRSFAGGVGDVASSSSRAQDDDENEFADEPPSPVSSSSSMRSRQIPTDAHQLHHRRSSNNDLLSNFADQPTESEVQTFLVLKLPQPFSPAGGEGSSSDSISDGPESFEHRPPTRFSVAEGGYEAEGELDSGVSHRHQHQSGGGSTSDRAHSEQNTKHHLHHHHEANIESIDHEFTARVLTFRVGRERPLVRVLIWRKSFSTSTPISRGAVNSNLCVDVYAFHPRTNEVVAAHCPPAIEQWTSGTCLLDLLIPLKWWNSMGMAKGVSDGGANAFTGRYSKIKIGFSAFSASSKASETDSSSIDPSFCRASTTTAEKEPAAGSSASSSSSYVLSADAQRSLRIFGEIELIYPSEYALLPLNHVVKVLVPTIDYYPGTTFTVPIFIHYEPPKLNNSSIYLLQLRARASGHLRVVGVEGIDPDWAITFNIEDSGRVVTATASHRSVSLNESWAGEVFVLIVRIERDTSSANLNNQRPAKGSTVSAQLTWSVRLVVDNGQGSTEKTNLDTSNDDIFLYHDDDSIVAASSSTTTVRSTTRDQSASDGQSQQSTTTPRLPSSKSSETVSTHVNVQPDRVDTLAVIGDDEIVNMAVINGRQSSLPIRVISVSQGGIIDDVTPKCHCVAIDPSSLKVSAECNSVYVDGTETKSNTNAAIGVQYGSYRTVARFTVWYPEFPIDIWLADPVLHAVVGWTVPVGFGAEAAGATGTPQKQSHYRARRHNNDQRHARVVRRRSKSTTTSGACRQKFQESELKIYARFRAVDSTTGGQTYLGGSGRKVQLDLTQVARPYLRVKNTTVARLVHTKYATYVEGLNEGRTEIQLKSPVQRHPYGSSVVETANELVHVRSLSAEVITGLFFHSELKSASPPVYNLAIYKSGTFFRQYQDGTVSLTLKYSDGHRTNLDALDASYYRLYVSTNGSITLFPGTSNGRHRHSSSPLSSKHDPEGAAVADPDGAAFLPVKILTVDEHAEGARLNLTLSTTASCTQKGAAGILGFVTIPVEYPRQRRNPSPIDHHGDPDPSEQRHSAAGGFNSKPSRVDSMIPLDASSSSNNRGETTVLTLPTLEERSSLNVGGGDNSQTYGNAPLLASISVSIFAVAGVLFAVCAVREGWVTVKTFARARCRQWRLLVPLSMNVPPLVFTSAANRNRRLPRRRSDSTCSSNSMDDDDEDESPELGRGNRNRRLPAGGGGGGAGKTRRPRRNSRPGAECTESSVVSAENEFVWLRPMSLTSSSNSNGAGGGHHFGSGSTALHFCSSTNGTRFGSGSNGSHTNPVGTVTRSLNGEQQAERHSSTSGHRSLNDESSDRRSANGDKAKVDTGGRDNAEYVISESEFLDCREPVTRPSPRRRSDGGAAVRCSTSASTVTSSTNSLNPMESKDDDAEEETFTDTDPSDPLNQPSRSIAAMAASTIGTRIQIRTGDHRATRKMSEALPPRASVSRQRGGLGGGGSYILHEGSTTLPSGWSGSEDYGSICGSPPSRIRNESKTARRHSRNNNNNSSNPKPRAENSVTDMFVQRLLSARSDPSVHIRPTPTTAEAAAAAVQAAKRQSNNNIINNNNVSRLSNEIGQPPSRLLANGQKQRPQSFFAGHQYQLRNSVCSATSSGGTSSDIYWDSSTLGMNETELRDYFNCLRESVT